MKRKLTEEQIAKRDERRARFKTLWAQIAKLDDMERARIAGQYGFRTVEGRELSMSNQMLIALQCPGASVLGGFRQWLGHGRAVRKGQHGAMIWCPAGTRKTDTGTAPTADAAEAPAGDNDRRFIVGTVFDISQTEELQAKQVEEGGVIA